VKKGLARVAYVYPPNTQHLSTLKADQSYAKSHHMGIWSISHYVTSSDYSLPVACPWAAHHGYSTRGCTSTDLSSVSKSGKSGASAGSSSSTSTSNKTTTSKSSSSGTISIMSSQLSVTPGQNASVTVKTQAGVTGKIEVDYKSGPSSSKSLYPKSAGSSGTITWTWRVGTRTTPGNWTVTISANGKTVKTTLHVK
jgi:micrococcal nuclease